MDLTDAGKSRLEDYLETLGSALGHKARRASFATYALGLLSDAERKSVEPIAARARCLPEETDAAHQRLLHFLTDASWDDGAVRLAAAQHALKYMTAEEPVEAWIIDDTGFLKQGKHSVGVQRQYTGSAGKVTNCQVAVSLSLATRGEHLPVDFELYLPTSWTEDAERRREAGIPEERVFKTKPQLALEMVTGALAAGLPRGVVLADAAYGTSGELRLGLQRLGLQYSLGVDPRTSVFEVGEALNRGGQSIQVRALANKLESAGLFEQYTWRQGTKGGLSARFAVRRVAPCAEQKRELAERPSVWLIIEWRDGEAEPSNYFLCSLPEDTPPVELIRLTMQRWRTERAYQDLKGELGLDHFEGRRWRGWNHHVSVVLACYAFAVAERHRFFPLTSQHRGQARAHRRPA